MREIQRKRFGKYLLLDRVAIGGMAELFRAKFSGEEGFEKLVAVKRILPHLAVQEELVTAFIEEAKLAALLEHQNLVRIFDFGSMGESFFIAMEYLYGRDLRGIAQRGKVKEAPLSLENALYIVSRVCAGLAYAHNRKDFMGRPLNLVHRDISPQNIFITWEGEVKVLDFGIAKAATRSSMTQVGIIKGKVAYMSPEQAAGRPIDHRSDIFSTGILLHELVTGERMFEGETLEILRRVQNVEYRPARQVRNDLPPCLIKVLESALAKEVDGRYQSCGDMLADLEECAFETSLRPSSQGLAKYARFLFQEDMATEEVELKEIAGMSDEEGAEWDVTKTMPTLQTRAPAPPEQPKTKGKSGWLSGAKGLLMVAVGILVLGLGALFVWWSGERPAEAPVQPSRVAATKPAETEPQSTSGQPVTAEPKPQSPAAREAERQKRIAGLLASAKESLEASKADEAEGFFQELLGLDAGNEEAKAGLGQVKELRERLAQEAERQKRVAGLISSGQQSLAGSRADEAEGYFRQALELDPGNEEAKAGLGQVKKLRERLAQEAERQKRVAGLVSSGRQSLAGSRADEAEGYFRQALELDPGSAEAKAGLGQVKELRERLAQEAERQKRVADLLTSGREALKVLKADEAEKYFHQVLELEAGNEEARNGLQVVLELRERVAREMERQRRMASLLSSGREFFEASKIDEAEGYFKQALEMNSGSEEAKAGLRQVKELRERLAQEAERQKRVASLLASAKQSLEASQADEAEEYFHQVLELEAGNEEARSGLQVVLELRERVARETERRNQIAGLLASARESLGASRADEAEGHFKQVLELEAGSAEAKAGLLAVQKLRDHLAARATLKRAEEALEKKLFAEAVGLFGEAMVRAPELAAEFSAAYSKALREQAMAIASGNPDGAEALLLKAIELDPKSARGYFLLGLNHFGKKEHAKAIEAYQEAAKRDPQSADTFFNLGYVHALTGDLEKAEKMYRHTVELAPPYLDEALFNLAVVQEMRGKAKECRKNLEKAVVVNPKNKTAKEMLEKPNSCSGGKK